MHICRNSLHCTVLKNKIDLNRGQGRKSLTPFVVAHSKVWEWYVVERDWKFINEIAIISCKNENFIVWLIKKMMNIQLDRGAGFISTF